MKTYVSIILTVFLLITLPILTFTYSYTVVDSVQELNDVEVDEREDLTRSVIDFLKFNEDLPDAFTTSMKNHFHDVRTIILTGWIISLLSLILLYNIDFDKREVYKKSAVTYGILILFIAFLAAFNFDLFFTYFHELLFPQGNWRFPPNSLIIKLFPESFFISATWICLATSTIATVLLYLTSRRS